MLSEDQGHGVYFFPTHEWREKMTQETIVTVLGSWVLSLAYTLLLAAGHNSTWIQFIWKVEGLSVLLDSQGALCGLLLYLRATFPFYQRAALYTFLLFP